MQNLNHPNGRSFVNVKEMTCSFWARGHCIHTEAKCLYAHSHKPVIADRPVVREPGSRCSFMSENRASDMLRETAEPAVAGKNANSQHPRYFNWRSDKQLGHKAGQRRVDPPRFQWHSETQSEITGDVPRISISRRRHLNDNLYQAGVTKNVPRNSLWRSDAVKAAFNRAENVILQNDDNNSEKEFSEVERVRKLMVHRGHHQQSITSLYEQENSALEEYYRLQLQAGPNGVDKELREVTGLSWCLSEIAEEHEDRIVDIDAMLH